MFLSSKNLALECENLWHPLTHSIKGKTERMQITVGFKESTSFCKWVLNISVAKDGVVCFLFVSFSLHFSLLLFVCYGPYSPRAVHFRKLEIFGRQKNCCSSCYNFCSCLEGKLKTQSCPWS